MRRLGDTQGKREAGTYKQTRAHVRKDDGRMQVGLSYFPLRISFLNVKTVQAYGWSLPAKPKASTVSAAQFASCSTKESQGRGSTSLNEGNSQGKHLPVPVPIYCRPFMEQTPGMKVVGLYLTQPFHLSE